MRNGTGGLLVVDIDAKHGGSLELMAERFPGSTFTRTIQTVSPGEDGQLGSQLIYALPEGFKIRSSVLVRNEDGEPMIEIAAFAMLPGSRARGSDEVMRTYVVVRDISVYAPTPELLAAVEGRTVVPASDPDEVEIEPTQARARVERLLKHIASAGDGQRNEVFTRYALPVVRLCVMLGEDPQTKLTTAYEESGGSDGSWVKAAIRSAVRLAGDEPGGWTELGPLASAWLVGMQDRARFAPWPGKSGASDRRVFLAVVGACIDQDRTETAVGTRALANRAGVSRETVEASLKRLEAAKRLETMKVGGFVVRTPSMPSEGIHISSPFNVRKNHPFGGSIHEGIDPLHMVWSSPKTSEGLGGLDGRHGQLFDLVCVGLTTARALADHTGSRADSLSRTLARLVEVGLLVKTEADYAPAENASALMDRLALELGGIAVCARRENQYRDEFREWEARQKQQGAPSLAGTQPAEWVELSDEEEAEIERELADEKKAELHERQTELQRWYDEQELLRQVGLPNDLG